MIVITADDTPHNFILDVVRRTYADQPGEYRYRRVLVLRDLAGEDLKENVGLRGWYERDGFGSGCTSAGRIDAPGNADEPCDAPEKRKLGLVLRVGGSNDRITITDAARRSLYKPEVWSGEGDDTVIVGAWADVTPAFLLGGGGNDRLIGSRTGREAFYGGPGDDRITPGDWVEDHVDGGHGDFDAAGRPVFRPYVNDGKECAARTQGFWDRSSDDPVVNQGKGGVDTLDLRSSNSRGAPTTGVLADLNLCRLAYFGDKSAPTRYTSLVHGIEIVRGTDFNDRLVGDGTGTLVVGNAGHDWLSAERGGVADARDDGVDTVRCLGAGSNNLNWVDRVDKKLLGEAGKQCNNWKVWS